MTGPIGFLAVSLLGLLGIAACGRSSPTTGATAGATSSTSGSTGGSGVTGSTGGSGGSSGSSTGTSSGGTSTGGFTPAPHNPFPQILNNGTPVIATPEVVTVSFAGYPFDVRAYAQELVQSSWLSAVGADYGVSLGKVAGSIVLDGGPSAITDPQIRDLLSGLIADAGIPPPTADTIYMVTFPESTTITLHGAMSCGFGGYHRYFTLADGTPVSYAVVATCPLHPGGTETVEQGVERRTSHEFIEAATNPLPGPGTEGYSLTDATDPWTFCDGEVADLCYLSPDYVGSAGGFYAARVWSNSAALPGTGSPCIPVPTGEVYRNVSVDPGATAIVMASDVQNQSVTLTFKVTGWSTAPVPDWNLLAYPTGVQTFSPGVLLNGGTSPVAMNNAKTATLTVTVPQGTPSGGYAGITLYSFMLTDAQAEQIVSFDMAAVYIP